MKDLARKHMVTLLMCLSFCASEAFAQHQIGVSVVSNKSRTRTRAATVKTVTF